MCVCVCVCVCVCDYMCMYMSILPIDSVYDFTLLTVNSYSLAQSVSWGKDDLLLRLLSSTR